MLRHRQRTAVARPRPFRTHPDDQGTQKPSLGIQHAGLSTELRRIVARLGFAEHPVHPALSLTGLHYLYIPPAYPSIPHLIQPDSTPLHTSCKQSHRQRSSAQATSTAAGAGKDGLNSDNVPAGARQQHIRRIRRPPVLDARPTRLASEPRNAASSHCD